MMQRIQSLYLLCVALLIGAMSLTPLSVYKIDNAASGIELKNSISLMTDLKSGEVILQNYPSLILYSIIIIFSFSIIFLFKNRRQQIKLCRINFFIITVFIFLLYFYDDFLVMKYAHGSSFSNTYLFGSYAPFAALLLVYLAIGAIKKDEELVRSADRIR